MRRTLLVVPLLCVLSVAVPMAAMARTLTFGTSGSDVSTLQTQLVKLGYFDVGNINGYFGPATLKALQTFQCAKGIACATGNTAGYGTAGPKTQAALASALLAMQPSQVTGGSLTGNATGKFEVSGWVPAWRAATGTMDTLPHLGQMTSVMPFGYGVSSDGHLIDKANITQEPWLSFIAAAKAQKVRVVPTIMWGDGEVEQAILSNSTSRVALEDEVAAMVTQNGFSGVDIDFEAKQAQTKDYFTLFLKGLYARIGATKFIYCAIEARMPIADRYSPGAQIPVDATTYANDYVAINKYCDRVEVMAYDQGTVDVRLDNARSAPYAPVADPGWVSTVVSLAAQTIAKNKIIIGIPTYGYEYSVTPQAGSGFEYTRLWAFNPNYATQIATQLGITPSRTSANELGFIYDPAKLVAAAPTGGNSTQTQQQTTPATTVVVNQGSQVNTSQPFNYMTWSDASAIADKVALAHQLGVRGVAVFSLGGAEDQAMWSVLK